MNTKKSPDNWLDNHNKNYDDYIKQQGKDLESIQAILDTLKPTEDRKSYLLKNPPILTFDQLEAEADSILSLWDFSEPIYKTPVFFGDQVNAEIIVERLLQEKGFRLVYIETLSSPDGSKIHGRTLFKERVVEIVELPRDHHHTDVWTLRTTLSHELFHALNHTDYVLTTQSSISSASPLERNAKDFARIFLLPPDRFKKAFKEEWRKYEEDHLLKRISKNSIDDEVIAIYLRSSDIVLRLAERFAVSTMSIVLRIKDLKIIDPNVVQSYLLSPPKKYFSKQSYQGLTS